LLSKRDVGYSFSVGTFLSTGKSDDFLRDAGAGLGLFFNTFKNVSTSDVKNVSTSDDFVFGSYDLIIRCITGLLVSGDGGGDGGLGKVSSLSTDFSDNAPSSRVSWTGDSGVLFSLLPPYSHPS
jgi:hypothetical protein